MDVLKCAVLVTMMTLSSCAKLNYIVEQGIGQYDLLTASRPNEVYLNDPEIPEEIKQKISYVEKARDHFSKYWESEKQRTYSRTTLLNRKAVSYLVISSPTSRIKAQDRCFWFVGCFPYIGFFSEDSAREFAEEIENNEVETYMRPVYAYSSLGYFEDPILSSFFVFDRVELTELVFHELYHLYFFVKNEVELNENLAQFVAQKMTEKYFDLPDGTRENSNNIYEEMKKALVDFTQKLQYKYEEMREQNRNDFKKQRELFIENEFRPFFQEFCEKNWC
jgi:predicted aminopeptidase